MIIYDVEGKALYKDGAKTMRSTLENAVLEGINLYRANFRRAKLSGACLDGLVAHNACFWGANLANVDLCAADIRGSDMRNTNLEGACFAEANLSSVDFRGGFFKNTILEETVMSEAVFSGGSLFLNDLSGTEGLADAFYCTADGNRIPFLRRPIVIHGLSRCMVLIGGYILWGDKLFGISAQSRRIPREISEFLQFAVSITQKDLTQSVKNPNPYLSRF